MSKKQGRGPHSASQFSVWRKKNDERKENGGYVESLLPGCRTGGSYPGHEKMEKPKETDPSPRVINGLAAKWQQ